MAHGGKGRDWGSGTNCTLTGPDERRGSPLGRGTEGVTLERKNSGDGGEMGLGEEHKKEGTGGVKKGKGRGGYGEKKMVGGRMDYNSPKKKSGKKQSVGGRPCRL